MRYLCAVLITVLVIAAQQIPVEAQSLSYTHYHTWAATSLGAAGDTVYCASSSGIIRVDTVSGSDSRIGETEYGIVTTPDGILWTHTSTELMKFAYGTWESYPMPEEYPEGWSFIRSIAPAGDSSVIMSIRSLTRPDPDCEGNHCVFDYYALIRFSDGEWEELYGYGTEFEPVDGFYYLTADPNSAAVYAARYDHIYVVPPDPSEPLQVLPHPYQGMEAYNGSVMAIMSDRSGDIRLIWDTGALWVYDRDSETWTQQDEIPLPATREGVLTDADDAIWIGTAEGLKRYDTAGITTYTQDDGLVSGSILSLHYDISGMLWIGTDNGISGFDGTSFTSYLHSGLPAFWSNAYSCIAVDHDGTVLLARSDGVVSFRDNVWSYTPFPAAAIAEIGSSVRINDMAVDADNTWWFATNAGVLRFDGTNYHRWSEQGGTLPDNIINQIEIGPYNRIWIVASATYPDDTLLSFSGDGWETIPVENMDDTNAILTDNVGALWLTGDIQFHGALQYYRNVQLTHFLVSLQQGNPFKVYSIAVDSANDLWMMYTNADGMEYLGRISNGTVTPIRTFPVSGYFMKVLQNDFEIDSDGNCWIMGVGGLASYNGYDWALYGTGDRVLLNQYISDIEVDHENRVWVATSGGITCIDGGSVTGVEQDAPGGYPLTAVNYPNPFNPATIIRFTLPAAGATRVSVYNVVGQLVTTLIDRPLQAGAHTVSFDGSALPSGVYFYRITSPGHAATGKMLLMK